MWNEERGSQQTPDSISVFYTITPLQPLMMVSPNPEVPHSRRGLGIVLPSTNLAFTPEGKKKTHQKPQTPNYSAVGI